MTTDLTVIPDVLIADPLQRGRQHTVKVHVQVAVGEHGQLSLKTASPSSLVLRCGHCDVPVLPLEFCAVLLDTLPQAVQELQSTGGSVEVVWNAANGPRTPSAIHLVQRDGGLMPQPPGRACRGKASILLVDDQPLILRGLSRICRRMGHEIHTAHSGMQALETLAQDASIGCIFTDLNMPGMSGMQVYRFARMLRPDLHGQIVLLSGQLEPREETVPFLRKPTPPAMLRERINTLLHTPEPKTPE